MVYARDELFDARKGAASDGLVGNLSKEALGLIAPGAVARREMYVPARAIGQPSLDLRMIVRGVVIDDAVDVQVGRYALGSVRPSPP